MSKITRWKKGFSFKIADENIIKDFLRKRDIEKYPVEGDYVADVFREFKVRSIKIESDLTPEQIKKLCQRELLSIIGGVPTCNQRVYPFGLKHQEYFIYMKGHPLEGKIMSHADIERACDKCTKGFTEDPRIEAIVKLVTRDEIDIYICKSPNSPHLAYTAFKDAKVPCPEQAGKQVRIDRTCIKNGCPHLDIQKLRIPKIVIED